MLRFQAMKAAPAFGGHRASYHPEIFILETVDSWLENPAMNPQGRFYPYGV